LIETHERAGRFQRVVNLFVLAGRLSLWLVL
jgi:hypothetical protein